MTELFTFIELHGAKVWYQQGLRFQCTRCGNCCTIASGNVWLNRKDVEHISGYLEIPEQIFRERYCEPDMRLRRLPAGRCVFYNGTGCSIHPAKPSQCKAYPFLPGAIMTPHTWAEMAKICPGIGKGPIWTVIEINRASMLLYSGQNNSKRRWL